MLIEAAWSCRFPARISREPLLRQEDLAKPIRDTAWKAQERLCRRYRKLVRVGKLPTVATAAIARELTGFAWAIAQQAHPPALDAPRVAGRQTEEVTFHQGASKAGQGRRHDHGQKNPRRYYQPDRIRRWTLDRGSSATHHRSGGNQPAHQSMINRRFMSVPPAMPNSGHAQQLDKQATNFHACSLKWRT